MNKSIILIFLFLAAIISAQDSNAAMGGLKNNIGPCSTKVNPIAQYSSLKSANKQSYCIALSSNLFMIYPGYSMTWSGAASDALTRGGKLTGIRSAEEQNFVNREIAANSASDIWVSGYYNDDRNQWIWADSKVAFSSGNYDLNNFKIAEKVYTNWSPEEPNFHGYEKCVSVVGWGVFYNYYNNAQWNNLPCWYGLDGYLLRTD